MVVVVGGGGAGSWKGGTGAASCVVRGEIGGAFCVVRPVRLGSAGGLAGAGERNGPRTSPPTSIDELHGKGEDTREG